jgi:hypothetical protein
MPREGLLSTLRGCVAARTLAPLEAVAAEAGADQASARGLLELFAAHRRAMGASDAAPAEEQQTAPPQTGVQIAP